MLRLRFFGDFSDVDGEIHISMNSSAIIDLSGNRICPSFVTSSALLHELRGCDGAITQKDYWCTKWMLDLDNAEVNASLYSIYENYFFTNPMDAAIYNKLKAARISAVDFSTCKFGWGNPLNGLSLPFPLNKESNFNDALSMFTMHMSQVDVDRYVYSAAKNMLISSSDETKCPVGGKRNITVLPDMSAPFATGGEVDLGFGIIQIHFSETIKCPINESRALALNLPYILKLQTRNNNTTNATYEDAHGVSLSKYSCLLIASTFTRTIQFVMNEQERARLVSAISATNSSHVRANFLTALLKT